MCVTKTIGQKSRIQVFSLFITIKNISLFIENCLLLKYEFEGVVQIITQ